MGLEGLDRMKPAGLEGDEGSSHYDGQTDDFDFDEDEGMLMVKVYEALEGGKKFILQPMLIGFAAAIGMSVGYAVYDFTTSLFTRSKSSN